MVCKPRSLINDPSMLSDELTTPILIPAPLNCKIVSESYKDSIPNNNADENEAMNNWIRMEITMVRSRMTEASSFLTTARKGMIKIHLSAHKRYRQNGPMSQRPAPACKAVSALFSTE